MSNQQYNQKRPFQALETEGHRLVLSGFRRDSYAGVFTPVSESCSGRYICDLLLDGLGRKVQVKASGLLVDTRERGGTPRTAAIYGLPYLLRSPKAQLLPDASLGAAENHFTASFDLEAAMLSITVMPFSSRRNFRGWVCILEVHRHEDW